jgi:protein-tyrosine phosphatase
MVNVLYVCYANRCRSAAAVKITQEAMRQRGISELELHVDSAGTNAPSEYGMIPEMRDALYDKRFRDLSHSSKKTTRELLLQQDYIICMDKKHIRGILELVPEKKGRVYTLPGAVGSPYDITHPHDLIKGLPESERLKRMREWSLDEIPAIAKPVVDFIDTIGSITCHLFGYVYWRNESRVKRLHERVAGQIQRYVAMFLDKLVEEGVVHANPIK